MTTVLTWRGSLTPPLLWPKVSERAGDAPTDRAVEWTGGVGTYALRIDVPEDLAVGRFGALRDPGRTDPRVKRCIGCVAVLLAASARLDAGEEVTLAG